jgi:hypothetical protein
MKLSYVHLDFFNQVIECGGFTCLLDIIDIMINVIRVRSSPLILKMPSRAPGKILFAKKLELAYRGSGSLLALIRNK